MKTSQLGLPAAGSSMVPLWFVSCQTTMRRRWLRVAESIVTVITPPVGIGTLKSVPVGLIAAPLSEVNAVNVLSDEGRSATRS